MFYVVFIDPPEQAHLASEEEAIAWIKSRLPTAAFTAWQGRTRYAYPAGGQSAKHCSAFIIKPERPTGSP